MRLIIDTQAFLWVTSAPGRLPANVQQLVRDSSTDLVLSAASSWEIAIKFALGKLRLPAPPIEYVTTRAERHRLTLLPVEHRHALQVATLPDHHRDPFDRLLVAQGQLEGLPILTADPNFSRYDVETIWG